MGWKTTYPGTISIAYLVSSLPGIASDNSADISDLMNIARYFYANPKNSCIESSQNSRACRLIFDKEEPELCDTTS